VTETIEESHSVQTSPQLSRFSMTRASRSLGVVAYIVLILGVAIGSYFVGRIGGFREEKAANGRILQLENGTQKLTADNTNQLAEIALLQTQIKNVQAKLAAIMPSENTYNISPNQSMIVADGHLTIGLIGPPMNERVNLNINGKQQSAAAGDIVNIALDPSTTCQVGVKSFDMFKAVLAASCAAVKPN